MFRVLLSLIYLRFDDFPSIRRDVPALRYVRDNKLNGYTRFYFAYRYARYKLPRAHTRARFVYSQPYPSQKNLMSELVYNIYIACTLHTCLFTYAHVLSPKGDISRT